jgi:hypothetical protein
MITDSNGNVALRYYQPTGKYVMLSNKHEYVFRTVRNVCLAWVQPSDVDQMLATTHECCGGSRKNIFFVATQQQVNIWTGEGDFRPTVNG